MLQIKKLTKEYGINETKITALRSVSLSFRPHEFVSVLGPSGCGKTTLLNLIGGLDVPTSGDILFDNISASGFSETDWNVYRNAKLGFVFQNYNLIPHLSVKENIALSLQLSGKKKEECEKRVQEILKEFDLEDLLHKKVTELSGGQAQRVAIARAVINDAEIILADEPTGALDSERSEQVMRYLQKIANDRLVIMVTHNADLAQKFSSRIIKMKDGEVVEDSDPNIVEEKKDINPYKRKKKTPFINFFSALKLGVKNLVYKLKRSVLTTIACSIGIVGLGLVLSFYNGVDLFFTKMQENVMSAFPVNIYEYSIDYSVFMDIVKSFDFGEREEGDFPTDGEVRFVNSDSRGGVMGQFIEKGIRSVKVNDISDEFIAYLNNMNKNDYDALHYYYGIKMNLISRVGKEYKDVSPDEVQTTVMNIVTSVLGEKGLEKAYWNQLVGNNAFMKKHYDLMEGRWPISKEDLVLVVNERNELDPAALTSFGFDITKADVNGDGVVTFDELLSEKSGFELKMVSNDAYYEKTGKTLSKYPSINEYQLKIPSEEMYNSSNAVTLKICGILRPREDANVNIVGANLCYLPSLSQYAIESASQSEITKEQIKLCELEKEDVDESYSYTVIKGNTTVTDRYVNNSIVGLLSASLNKTAFMKSFGVDQTPVYIGVYASDFQGKKAVCKYIDDWEGQVKYFDITDMFMYNADIVINISFYVLLILSVISLIVSSIMMGIITGNSVTERTKEIGILRSLGARQKDILYIFLSELLIIGFFGGLFGVAISYALTPALSAVINSFCGIQNLSSLNPLHALILLGLSVALSLIAGLFPARRAARKRIVEAIRLE